MSFSFSLATGLDSRYDKIDNSHDQISDDKNWKKNY
jgi:hypothetical protein